MVGIYCASIHPEDLAYQLGLILAGGDEQLASQPCLQDCAADKVIVKEDVDIGEVVLNISSRKGLRKEEKLKNGRSIPKSSWKCEVPPSFRLLCQSIYSSIWG